MKRTSRPLLTWMVTVALAATSVRAEPVAVRLDIGGRAFVGQVEEQPAVPASQPADQPVALAIGDAPAAVHLDAKSLVEPTTLRDTRVTWDFGDPAGAYNTIEGYNAAHVYDAPGIYTITRTVASPSGQSVSRIAVEVKPDARKAIYVSAEGDDKNDATSPQRAVRSWSRAVAAIGPNTSVLFRRGDEFVVDRPIELRADNVRLGAFGEAGKARPLLTIPRKVAMFLVETGSRRLLVEDLAFNATYAKTFDKADLPDLFHPSGNDLVIRRCTFLNINTVVNGNGSPIGVLLVDNELPLETGLRSYFAWIEGDDWTLLGNRAANSTREHIVRCGNGHRVNIQFNSFANLDRTQAADQPDGKDNAKAALNLQKGSVLYVAHNTLRGANGVGPLGKTDGLKDKGARFIGAVVEDNRIDGILEVNHGTQHLTYRNNVVRLDDNVAMPVAGFEKEYGRGVDDLLIEHNTVINAAATGNFIRMQPGATNVQLIGNLYIAPNLVPGAYLAAGLYVSDVDLKAFSAIRGNVWPTCKPNAFAQNGVNYVAPTWAEQSGYKDAAEWAAMTPPVEGDRFVNVTDLATLQVEGAGLADPSRLPTLQATPTQQSR